MTTIRPRRSYPGYAKPIHVPAITLRTRARWLLQEARRSRFARDCAAWGGFMLLAASIVTVFGVIAGG